MPTLIGTKRIDDDKRWAYVLVDVDGVPHKLIDVAPMGVDLQAWVDLKQDQYEFNILNATHQHPDPEVLFVPNEDSSRVAQIRAWIAAHPEIVKTKWDTVFPENTDETESFKSAALDRINLSQLKTMTFENLDTYISNIANLADAKAALQKIAEVVLALVKYQLKEG